MVPWCEDFDFASKTRVPDYRHVGSLNGLVQGQELGLECSMLIKCMNAGRLDVGDSWFELSNSE